MRARARRRLIGLLPALGQRLATAGGWLRRHPRPALFWVAFGCVLWGFWCAVRFSEAFRITQVILPEDGSLTLRRTVLGSNLWDVDLPALAEELQRQQPSLKAVRVVRQLPNTLRIEPIPRLPVAQVRINRWYPVDHDGFILPDGRAAPHERLLQLAGVDRSGAAIRVGQSSSDERLTLALRVAELIRRSWPRLARRVTELNVTDPRQIRLVLDGAVDVRCGSEAELNSQLGRLDATLRTLAGQPLDGRYIDVRFRDPVVGPRT